MSRLAALEAAVVECRRCPRLVDWREQVAREKRAAFRGEEYWGRPMQGFGDPAGRLLILGLAPAAHGANRTGRIFTGAEAARLRVATESVPAEQVLVRAREIAEEIAHRVRPDLFTDRS